MEENKTSQTLGCGCDCEQCVGNNHEACATGACKYSASTPPEANESQNESQQQ